jgi:hypothetical protein
MDLNDPAIGDFGDTGLAVVWLDFTQHNTFQHQHTE